MSNENKLSDTEKLLLEAIGEIKSISKDVDWLKNNESSVKGAIRQATKEYKAQLVEVKNAADKQHLEFVALFKDAPDKRDYKDLKGSITKLDKGFTAYKEAIKEDYIKPLKNRLEKAEKVTGLVSNIWVIILGIPFLISAVGGVAAFFANIAKVTGNQ